MYQVLGTIVPYYAYLSLGLALPAIWAFEIRAGKDIWADMGDYWGLSGNKEKTRYFW